MFSTCLCDPSYQDQDGEQDEEYETEEQLQARILDAALEFVPLHGWSADAIAAGAEVRGANAAETLQLESKPVRLSVCVALPVCVLVQTLGLSSASTGMFSNGAGDLVLHFITQCNSKLTEILAEQHKQIQLGQTECVHTHHTVHFCIIPSHSRHFPPFLLTSHYSGARQVRYHKM